MLEISHLTKRFKRKVALDDVSFTFVHGVYGLLGPNGAGKTTLLRCITLIYREGSAAVSYNHTPAGQDKSYSDRIGYLPQQFGMFKELTVREMMQLMANFKNVPRNKAEKTIEECIDMVNLSERSDTKVSSLSGGMIRRLGIAQTLVNDPEIIIFDEPTAGLDPEERLRFKSILSKINKDRTILISTHIVEDVEASCDHVIILDAGKIKKGATCMELQQAAEGKVYELLEADVSNLHGKYYVEKEFEQAGKNMLRILSNEPQEVASCSPTVEDGYICVLKDI